MALFADKADRISLQASTLNADFSKAQEGGEARMFGLLFWLSENS